jgi:hypothetical protein
MAYNPEKANAGPDENAPVGYDWLGQPKDPRLESLRSMSVDECVECDGGRLVRYCSIHGLNGSAPR